MAITLDWVKSLRADIRGDCGKGWNLRGREVGGKMVMQIDRNDIELIILDLMLPVLNALELRRKIRNEENYTPILILSAKDNKSDRFIGLEVGADDFLTKPCYK